MESVKIKQEKTLPLVTANVLVKNESTTADTGTVEKIDIDNIEIINTTDVYSKETVKEIQRRTNIIKTELKKAETSFFKIAFNLYWIKENNAYKVLGYDNIEQFARDEFGIKKTTCYDYLNVVERFGVNRNGVITDLQSDYKSYSSTKLIAMSSLTDTEIKENIKPGMSVSEIKKVKKEIEKKQTAVTSDNTDTSVDEQEKEFVFESEFNESGFAKIAIYDSLKEYKAGKKDMEEQLKACFSKYPDDVQIAVYVTRKSVDTKAH